MSLSSGSYDYNLIGIFTNVPANTAIVTVQLIDQTDGKIVSNKTIICPLDGVSPVLDNGRVLANQTPNGVITASTAQISAVQTALSGARDQNKLRP